jgi:hypothetical protein
MRKDMGKLVFKGAGFKGNKVRRRFVSAQLADRFRPAEPEVVVRDFRLGDEPEGCTVLRYLSVRQVSERGGWATAEIQLPVKGGGDREQTCVDEASSREPMRGRLGHYQSKETKVNFGVLKRFLGSRVGRNWGLVLGEIRRGCDGRSFQGHTIEQVLSSIVVTNVEVMDEQLWDVEFACELSKSPRRCRYFVHPTTGSLEHLPRPTKSAKQEQKRAEVERPEQVPIDEFTKLVRVAGIWYVVCFQPIPTIDEVRRNQPYSAGSDTPALKLPKDIILGRDAVNDPDNGYRAWMNKLVNYPVDSLRDAWGAEVYAVSKRQAGSRELKRYLPRHVAS